MKLKTITDGKVSGTAWVECEHKIIGGVLITADGTNAAVIKIYKGKDATGTLVFDLSTKQPLWITGPIDAAEQVYHDISGTGASAQLYEWVE